MKHTKIYKFNKPILLQSVLEIFESFISYLIKENNELKYYLITIELINPTNNESISLLLCEKFKANITNKLIIKKLTTILINNIGFINKHSIYGKDNFDSTLFQDIKFSYKSINYSDYINKALPSGRAYNNNDFNKLIRKVKD